MAVSSVVLAVVTMPVCRPKPDAARKTSATWRR